MKIGVMGGSFDPIHMGHLISAEQGREELGLDTVIFMPSGIHPFKGSNISSSEKRVEMTKRAIRDNPNFQISLIGVNRKGTNYTIDDIRDLKKIYPEDEIFFFIGTDIIYEIEKWKDFTDLAKICKFVLFNRWGQEKERLAKKIIELKELYEIDIRQIDTPLVEISSTEIRQARKKDRSIKYLVPESVEEYILENRIYRDE